MTAKSAIGPKGLKQQNASHQNVSKSFVGIRHLTTALGTTDWM